MNNASELDKSSAALNKFAALLAKVHGWLDLADNPVDATKTNYYSLALVPDGGQAPLSAMSPRTRAMCCGWLWCPASRLRTSAGSTSRHRLQRQRHRALSGHVYREPVSYDRTAATCSIFPAWPTCASVLPNGVDSLILLSTSEPLAVSRCG